MEGKSYGGRERKRGVCVTQWCSRCIPGPSVFHFIRSTGTLVLAPRDNSVNEVISNANKSCIHNRY